MPDRQAHPVDLGGWIALRVALVVLGVIAVVWLAFQLASVLLLVFVAIILAAGVLGPVRALERRGVPRVAAVVGIYLVLGGSLVVIGLLVIPPVLAQLQELLTQLPDLAARLTDSIRPLLDQYGVGANDGTFLDLVLGQLKDAPGLVSGLPFAVIGIVGAVVTSVFLSILVLLERRDARDWAFRFVAPGDRDALADLVEKAATRLGAYVRGQLLIMTVTGVGSAVGLLLLGVPFPVALGLLAFLTEAIPLAGPVIAGAVMVAIALLESPAQAIGTLVLVFALQQLEGLVLVPQIQGRVISISPAVALVAVLSGSAIGGIAGALVAIPAVAIATVVIEEVVLPWRRRGIAREPQPGDAAAT